MNSIPFTQVGYDTIKNEQELLTVKRKETVKSLTRAREMGDLSENALYKAVRMELGQIDRRLRHLTYLLKNAEITNAKSNETVNIGVKVIIDDGEKSRELSIVGGYESDPLAGKISPYSPLGKKLMGKKVGDVVYVMTPRGGVTYTIRTISL